MSNEQLWYVYDVNGQYSVSKFIPDGFRVAGPFTWDGAWAWINAHPRV